MQEILQAFGVDSRLIAIQIFNFLILIGVLWYFLYTPVLRLLSEREAKIKQGLDDAAKAKTALDEADIEKTSILKAAHAEASQIVEGGVKHAEEKGRILIEEAKDKAARELAQARESAADLKNVALKESESQIAQLAILAAEKLLRSELSK